VELDAKIDQFFDEFNRLGDLNERERSMNILYFVLSAAQLLRFVVYIFLFLIHTYEIGPRPSSLCAAQLLRQICFSNVRTLTFENSCQTYMGHIQDTYG